ncbi:UDP-N-acetylmuramoyl-tripeptide--D-alanyl-D-alanine ligase [Geomobilimonas luticola]|uniref:UDP-N-acetylmuramoyl-tripeptide--D-alanyl-D-alanine ligase n=1 Tax=Geomobilimonas luticola TaxID=1114878 RepID=A0ABS5SD66_9BACT|nr:UDP-N-acetylmuramoyl-tripeptide--D-alanyl-D-alanine ligase [Geomobilimonas luticola]MBT0653319.1 UDP-N-acetylmuramoyl-tripeptide--D-alanyl-D-alanine ligase [Geomobilimonas luticola]
MFTVEEIARATVGTISGQTVDGVKGISTDSRTVTAGELFIPLRGERFDGHDYIGAAAERGCRVLLAEKSWLAENQPPAGVCCIAVDDTLRALGDLAAFHRRRFTLPLFGVTGSNGKTTTKEMLAAILSLAGEGLKTSGNLNNLIGLPQMLLQLTPAHRWGVLEMGMSEPGEIARLTEITAPQVGVITNAFPAHLESMGSVDAVARAKGELFMGLTEGAVAVYNADDTRIAALPVPAGVKRLSFGLHGADVSAVQIEGRGRRGQHFVLQLPAASVTVTLHAYGRHNIYNALAAAAAAVALGIGPEVIRKGLETFTPYDKRFKVEEVDGVVLIDDSYNANPASMAAALVTLRELKEEGRAVAVLGDMLELGTDTGQSHQDVGRLAAGCVDRLYLVGGMAEVVASGAVAAGLAEEQIIVVPTQDKLIADLARGTLAGDVILVKGSRGMRMERVADAIRSGFDTAGRKGTT